MAQSICFEVVVNQSFEAALESVAEALKAESFGILSRTDMKQTLKEKLGVEIEPYLSLGVCNPALAYEFLLADPKSGLFLPCKVSVEGLAGKTRVSITDPVVLFQSLEDFKGNAAVMSAAEKARVKLERVAYALNPA